LKRGYARGRAYLPPLMVSVWDAETRVSSAACRAPGGNEVAGTLAVLKSLMLKGGIVTADALHCHPAMAEAVGATKVRSDRTRIVPPHPPINGTPRPSKGSVAGSPRRVSSGTGSFHHQQVDYLLELFLALFRIELHEVAAKDDGSVTRSYCLSRKFSTGARCKVALLACRGLTGGSTCAQICECRKI
jgi:predicted transposase YbfD/YdcC